MRSWLLGIFGLIVSAVIVFAVFSHQKISPPADTSLKPSESLSVSTSSPLSEPSGVAVIAPSSLPSTSLPTTPESAVTNQSPDLTTDASGLSKATVIMVTSSGTIQFKFYPNDAPATVKRIIELINKGFYNGLTFHRIVPNFVIQGGDPVGNGTGGSGQKLDAEFNNRRHVEGTVAMARASDPNSADSQFYISLGTFPHLDHNYTVFGQVVEGLDVARKIKAGDKMIQLTIQ